VTSVTDYGDVIRDLAALLAASAREDDPYAPAYRLAVRLRIAPETRLRVVEARLREALGDPWPPMTIESFLGHDGRRVAYLPKGAPDEEGAITGVGVKYVYVRYDGSEQPRATSPADLIFLDDEAATAADRNHETKEAHHDGA
jgi:hypothetical protein